MKAKTSRGTMIEPVIIIAEPGKISYEDLYRKPGKNEKWCFLKFRFFIEDR